MFGFIRPCLDRNEKEEYKCYYCGLCIGMGRCAGFLSRLLVNYDICIAYMVADSIYSDTEIKESLCPFSIYKIVRYRDNQLLLEHMSEINYILCYHNVLDDIRDDGSIKAKTIERIMRRRYNEVARKHQEIARILAAKMQRIHEIERNNQYIAIKDAAAPFGELLESVMGNCLSDPIDAQVFATLCKHLGIWVYTIDACIDLPKDIARKKYNPLAAGFVGSMDDTIQNRREEITSLLLNCKQTIQQLLELLSCAKNKELVYSIFEHMLPKEVAQMLQ